MISRSRFVAAGAALGLVPWPRAAGAQALVPLRQISFFSTTTLPVWAAQRLGAFAREGLDFTLTQATGSTASFQKLAAGEADLITAAADNMIAYDEGQADVAIPNPDFVAIMGADSGALRLYARPEIRAYGDLRGKTLPVDAVNSGYSLLLRQMLENGGLRLDDYTLEAFGGSPQRLAKIQSDPKYAATVLSTPYDLQAKRLGYTLLGTGKDGAANYMASATIARRSWLHANAVVATRYIRAVRSGLAWLFDPANAAAATAMLAERLKFSPEIAAEVFPDAIGPDGLFRDGRISAPGMATVLALRSKFGLPRKTLTDATKYYDELYYLAAVRG